MNIYGGTGASVLQGLLLLLSQEAGSHPGVLSGMHGWSHAWFRAAELQHSAASWLSELGCFLFGAVWPYNAIFTMRSNPTHFSTTRNTALNAHEKQKGGVRAVCIRDDFLTKVDTTQNASFFKTRLFTVQTSRFVNSTLTFFLVSVQFTKCHVTCCF